MLLRRRYREFNLADTKPMRIFNFVNGRFPIAVGFEARFPAATGSNKWEEGQRKFRR